MRFAQESECEAAGVDAKKVESIARRLASLGKEAKALGLMIFGGSGTGTLRPYGERPLIVARIGTDSWDGGCGATDYDSEGLERGE
jgi:hypothetical protein